MPSGSACFAAANPVEPGWSAPAWYRAYNVANSRIRAAEGPVAERAARTSGRTRQEARLLRELYSDVTGRQKKKRKRGDTASESPPRHPPPPSSPSPPPPPPPPPPPSNLPDSFGAMAVALPPSYPLSRAQAELVISVHEEENAKINWDLDAVRTLCEERCRSNTKKCAEHSKEVRSMWRKYYTTIKPGSWASYRSQDYVTEMKKLFDGKADIKKIHDRAGLEKRRHYKDTLCTVRYNDDPAVKQYKEEAAAMYDGNAPEARIREFISKKEREVKDKCTPYQLEYDSKLAACKTEDEKRIIYQEDACTPRLDDTKVVRKLRSTWLGYFESDMPYPEIFATMQKEISHYRKKERELKDQLDGFLRAKAALDKAKIAREEKKLTKEHAARVRMLSKYTYYCTTQNCQNLSVPISQDEGNLECGLCYTLFNKGMPRSRSYFCSLECMERAGDIHVRSEHACISGARCTIGVFNRSIFEFYSGVCPDCWKHFKVESYFCSNECYTKNWADHCKYDHTRLRAELTDKLQSDKDLFEEWSRKMQLTNEEVKDPRGAAYWDSDDEREFNLRESKMRPRGRSASPERD